jgi:murein DD-endopeptidase MepM/ murein hydrolase activator NlpD
MKINTNNISINTGNNSGSTGFNTSKENTDSQWVNEQTTLTGNDMLSGAVSGVSGEVFAELLGNTLYGSTIKEYGGLAGGLSALITGKLTGLDNKEIADNIYSGQRIGKNAVENNLLYDQLLGDSKTTSDYEKNRKHPTENVIRDHRGVDTIPIDDNDNKTVHAAANGISLGTYEQVNGKGWGVYTVIGHNPDEKGNYEYLSRYAHLNEETPNIPAGTEIKEGQPIGIMGNTGASSGPHLHFEIQKYNPETKEYDYINPQLPKNNIGNFEYLKDTPFQQNLNKK